MKRELIGRAFALLSPRQRRDFGIVVVLQTMAGVLSTLSLASIVPLLILLVDQEGALALPWMQELAARLPVENLSRVVTTFAVAAVVLVWLAGLLSILAVFAQQRFVRRIAASMASRAFDRYFSEPLAAFETRTGAELVRNIAVTSDTIANRLFAACVVLLSGGLQIILIIVGLHLVHAAVTWTVAGLIGSAYVGIYLLVRGRLTTLSRQNFADSRMLQQIMLGSYHGFRNVLVHGRADSLGRRFQERRTAASRRQADFDIISAVPRFLIEVLGFSVLVTVAFGLGRVAEDSSEFVATMAFFAVGAFRILPLAQQAYHAASNLTGALEVFRSIASEWGDLTPFRPLSGHVLVGPPRRLDITGLTFCRDQAPLWQPLTVSLKLKGLIRIAGPSGAGKTTLLEILAGLRAPSSGQVLIDGLPLDQLDLRSWWRYVAYMTQRDYLFEGTVADNICPAPECRDDERLTQVADVCALHEQLSLEHPVAEGGQNLSGGQQSRVLIARTLYRSSQLVCLDEAFSALDIATARGIISRMLALWPNRGFLVISHRHDELPEDQVVIELEAVGESTQ